VKWKEQQGVGADGLTNWSARWPAMRDILRQAQFDVICMQEVEHTDVDQITSDLGSDYNAHYFKHTKRPPDGVLIAVRSGVFDPSPSWAERDNNGVTFGGVDLVHCKSGAKVRVITGHMRGGRAEQLKAFSDFADEGKAEVTVITADFNEDFRSGGDGGVRCPFPENPDGRYVTLTRDEGLPQLSRPPNKQAEDQSSGKGKIDWIFVRGRVELFRDEASRRAILDSHGPCAATGDWPSDHGCEALCIHIPKQKREWWKFWHRSKL